MNDATRVLEVALTNAREYLGTVERNTEIKVVLMTLWALGWNPVSEIGFGFHIPVNRLGGVALAPYAADFVLRHGNGLFAVGEAKQWFASDRAMENSLEQIKRYQAALRTPRAFLTSGRRWLVFGESGQEILEIRHEDANADDLLAKLRPYLGPDSVVDVTNEENDWAYGIKPGKKRLV